MNATVPFADRDLDTMKLYLHDVRSFSVPSETEENQLIAEYRNGDQEARNRLAQRHLRLVISIAREYEHMGLRIDDLIQEGNIGLLEAFDSYQPSYGIPFHTYCTIHIRRSICDALDRDSRLIYVPRSARDLVIMPSTVSFDAPMNGEDEDYTMESITPSSVSYSADYVIGNEACRNELIDACRSALSAQESEVLLRYYGLVGGEESAIWRLAYDLGVSETRIRQVLKSACDKLRSQPLLRSMAAA